ncbi:MAG: tyrosine recombinase XerC [Clostridiaceae bacterium]|nr:tyrosine recombinase XerC [Clostridiaceae bacterium]
MKAVNPEREVVIAGTDTDTFPLLDRYSDYLYAIKGRTPRTIRAYHSDLSRFFRWMVYTGRIKAPPVTTDTRAASTVNPNDPIEGIDIRFINIDDIRQIRLDDMYAFISWLAQNNSRQAASRARRVSSLRGFFNWLHRQQRLIEENPAADLEQPRQMRRLPQYLSLDESRDLLVQAGRQDNQYSERDYCILTLFLNCGLRLSELHGINVSDLRGDTLVVLGKGQKERTIYLNDACVNALEDWLAVRPTENLNDPEALFISRQRNRLSREAIQHLVKKYIRAAGLNTKRYSVHKLRHTAATLMYQYGKVDIRQLQFLLGHESVATTEIYTHINTAELHQAVDSNPLSTQRIEIDRRTAKQS